jgi:hypothetical protein
VLVKRGDDFENAEIDLSNDGSPLAAKSEEDMAVTPNEVESPD